MNPIIALSYFHHKVGPVVYYAYPENSLDRDLSNKLANIMDQQYSEGFFTHSFENLKSMNYYFEINSDWARRNKEMLMISIIPNQYYEKNLNNLDKMEILVKLSKEVLLLCKSFSEQILSNEDIFAGFYINELNNYDEIDKERIRKNKALIKKGVQDLYWETLEITGERPEVVENEDEDRGDYEFTKPFPPIPPSSPSSAGGAKQKVQQVITQAGSYLELYCKHCGAELPKGQTICHVCGKKVI